MGANGVDVPDNRVVRAYCVPCNETGEVNFWSLQAVHIHPRTPPRPWVDEGVFDSVRIGIEKPQTQSHRRVVRPLAWEKPKRDFYR